MIIIPMAGISSRFFDAGYVLPKYMLKAHGKSLFEHSVSSFRRYFSKLPFLFIVRDSYDTEDFVRQEIHKIGINTFFLVVLHQNTRGQAETVFLGLEGLKKQGQEHVGPITIFNIDTFRPGFTFPNIVTSCDGYLEVFRGSGENWSFVKPDSVSGFRVLETAEKNPISDLCSTGLYYFSKVDDYLSAYNAYLTRPQSEWERAELYIAPMYNHLIKSGKDIRYQLIRGDEVIFCGIPSEYDAFRLSQYAEVGQN